MTQKEMVKLYLQKYKSITAMEGFNELFILDLAGVIRDLKHGGMDIDFIWIYKKNRFGRPVKFKKYFIKKPKNSFLSKFFKKNK